MNIIYLTLATASTAAMMWGLIGYFKEEEQLSKEERQILLAILKRYGWRSILW